LQRARDGAIKNSLIFTPRATRMEVGLALNFGPVPEVKRVVLTLNNFFLIRDNPINPRHPCSRFSCLVPALPGWESIRKSIHS
jgi:hypothetical protein